MLAKNHLVSATGLALLASSGLSYVGALETNTLTFDWLPSIVNDSLAITTQRVTGVVGWLQDTYSPTSWWQWVVAAALYYTGSVIPDIDNPSSYVGRWFKPLNEGFAHRGFTHTMWVLLVCWALYFVWLLVYLGLGIFTHLLVDDWSHARTVWWYPLFPSTWKTIHVNGQDIVVRNDSGYSPFRYQTGSVLEYVYSYVLLTAGLVIGAISYYPQLLGHIM